MSTYFYTPAPKKSFFSSPRKIPDTLTDKRIFDRRKCNFRISIKAVNNNSEFEAKTIDISRGGMGIEINKRLNIGDKLEIWIHSEGQLGPIHKYGRLVWLRKKDYACYNGGIKFESLISSYH
ncbi:MAG: hypothetical protein GF375_04390 [Candidatus Omnitrophica bacterium]|nr:hypothetical protein [Candidatus Omnitrophota bacterium]